MTLKSRRKSVHPKSIGDFAIVVDGVEQEDGIDEERAWALFKENKHKRVDMFRGGKLVASSAGGALE